MPTKKNVPTRAFNIFFGLGIPTPLQDEGFSDVLEPLKPLSDKLLIMRNVDHVRCDVRGINAHFDGATASFTAEPAGGEAKAGGALSILSRRDNHGKWVGSPGWRVQNCNPGRVHFSIPDSG